MTRAHLPAAADTAMDRFPVGMKLAVAYPNFAVELTLISTRELCFEIKDGPFARMEIVELEVIPKGNGLFLVSWREQDGATVINLQDYDRNLIHSFATLPDGQFLRMSGNFKVLRDADRILDDCPVRNKAMVLDAMTSLFQRHDVSTVERLYAPGYIQHNPAIPQGRDALAQIVANLAPDVHYEPGLMVAEGDLVAIHGRIRGWAETMQVVIDLFRIEGGKLAEHWDVLQDEVPVPSAIGSITMFNPAENSGTHHPSTMVEGAE